MSKPSIAWAVAVVVLLVGCGGPSPTDAGQPVDGREVADATDAPLPSDALDTPDTLHDALPDVAEVSRSDAVEPIDVAAEAMDSPGSETFDASLDPDDGGEPDAVDDVDAVTDIATDVPVDAPPSDAPRLIAPNSTSIVTSRRPTLRWELHAPADGAQIEICSDRACGGIIDTIDATGTSVAPPADLPTGVVYWRARSLTAGSAGADWTSTWEFVVGARSAPVDAISGSILDVNGDGFADVAIGEFRGSAVDVAHIYVYFGSHAGLPTIPSETIESPDGNGGFGTLVANLGDINGDGYGDIVVSNEYINGSRGRIYIYLGSPRGVVLTPVEVIDGPDGPGTNFGLPADGAGDIDGDGYGDTIVGAPGGGGGRIFIFRGGPLGLDPTPATAITGPDGGEFGKWSSRGGDVNGDGFADVVVGALFAPGSFSAMGPGMVYVYAGSATGLSTTPIATMSGRAAGDTFGHDVACAGDLDGDGLSDIVVDALNAPFVDPPGNGPGRVYIYWGATLAGTDPPSTTLIAPVGTYSFGTSLSGMSDVDGDGLADIFAGEEDGHSGDRAMLYLGVSGSTTVSTSTVLDSPTSGTEFASRVLNAGDIDGDGFADVVVTDWSIQEAFMYRGTATGLDPTPSVTLLGTIPHEWFGSAIADLWPSLRAPRPPG